jgi:uncharacterized membrane protein
MFSSPTLSHFSSVILLKVASYYQGSTIMMMMSMWYVILVPFFIMMVVVGNSYQNTHDSEEEIEVDNTYQGEEEGMEGDVNNENDSVMIPKKTKRSTHLCGSMSQGLGEGKGVEPQNLYATIVIQNTQVPISM